MNTTYTNPVCAQSAAIGRPCAWEEKTTTRTYRRIRAGARRVLPALLLVAVMALICILPLAYLAESSVRTADITAFDQATVSVPSGDTLPATIVRFEGALYLPQSVLLRIIPEAEAVDLPLYLYGDTSYVKAGDAADALAYAVGWDEAARTLLIEE